MTEEIIVEAEAEETVEHRGTAVEVREQPRALAVQEELSVEELLAQVAKVKEVAARAMEENVHYGKIPGTDKPTLLKPGAEKLSLVFRLAPRYHVTETWHDDGHLTVSVRCELYHVQSGNFLGEGVGLCSSRESKYAYRTAKRRCPSCGVEAIVWSKKHNCFMCIGNDKGGCWARFPKDAPELAGQDTGKVVNPDLPDTYNTILKMAKKRAHVDAVLTATAAGDVFTQDVEDSASSGEGSGDARGGQPAPAADARPNPEPPPEEQPKPEGDLPKEAAQARVTRMKNLALEKGAVKDEEEVERIIANHVTTTRLGYVDSPWVEGQIKMLEGMKPAEPKQEALA